MTEGLLQFDWSKDSKALRINTTKFELKFVNVETKKMISPQEAKDIE